MKSKETKFREPLNVENTRTQRLSDSLLPYIVYRYETIVWSFFYMFIFYILIYEFLHAYVHACVCACVYIYVGEGR